MLSALLRQAVMAATLATSDLILGPTIIKRELIAGRHGGFGRLSQTDRVIYNLKRKTKMSSLPVSVARRA